MPRPIVIVTIIVAVLLAALIFWLAGGPGQVEPDAARAPIPESQNAPAVADTGDSASASKAAAAPAAEPGFCERDFAKVAQREADVPELRQAGGLVHIFEREARLDDPYGCADFYLAHGLDVNAVDPRDDKPPLTGLFYAIQRNDPKMVRFMLGHGADLQKRAGKNDTRAMGYAYYLALKDQRIDRNEVIGILDSALTRQTAEAGARAGTPASPS